jgi:hypothetical protein
MPSHCITDIATDPLLIAVQAKQIEKVYRSQKPKRLPLSWWKGIKPGQWLFVREAIDFPQAHSSMVHQ